jgi:phospho-N-acetylmuramoyl-pentapeptide-transferase
MHNILPLALGLIIFSFIITGSLTIPFINLLYNLKLIRRKEMLSGNKASLFDKLHDKKAGTPIGGGILLVATTLGLFAFIIPLMNQMGVTIQSSFDLASEQFIIFFTFIAFGLIGLLDDYKKIFSRPKPGKLGAVFGLTKKQKFLLQTVSALIVAIFLYSQLGIQILYLPIIGNVLNLGIFYIPFAAFVIIFFANAFNITDGLDGLSTGLLIIYLFAFIILAAGNLDTPLFIFISIWIGALMAFAYFNVYPARIFLGDTGALAFGAMIALIGLIIGNVASQFVIGGLFVAEATSSLVQILGWKFLKRRILPIAPLHHTFEVFGWEEPKIVMRAWLAGIMLAIFGLWLATI